MQVSQLELCFPGSPRIELAGEEIRIGRRKALALLAYELKGTGTDPLGGPATSPEGIP